MEGSQLKIFQRMRKSKPVAASGQAEQFSWTLDANGVLTISGAGVIDSLIGTPWNAEKVASVVLKDGVTGVGLLAFCGYPNLKSVKLPDSVSVIGGCAFQDCASLQSVAQTGLSGALALRTAFPHTGATKSCLKAGISAIMK